MNNDVMCEDRLPLLHEAVRVGSRTTVQRLLEEGLNPDELSDAGEGALHLAADHGQLDIARALIRHGADPNLLDREGQTPLHRAVCRASAEMVQLLIDGGANVNATDNSGYTPVYWAAICCQADTVRLLVSVGGDANARPTEGETAIHRVARYLFGAQTLEALIEGGATVNVRDGNGRTPLHIAAAANAFRSVAVLLQNGADPNALDDAGKPSIVAALQDSCYLKCPNLRWPEWQAEGGDRVSLARVVRAAGAQSASSLISGTANPPAHSNPSTPAPSAAGTVEEPDVTSLLLAAGASIGGRDQFGSSLLHLAAAQGLLRAVASLLDSGADPNAVDGDGETPLHHAAGYGSTEATSLLIQRGADLNARSGDGSTPLHHAAQWGPRQTVELLLGQGAAMVANTEGKTPVDLARRRRRKRIVEILKAAVDQPGADAKDKGPAGSQTLERGGPHE